MKAYIFYTDVGSQFNQAMVKICSVSVGDNKSRKIKRGNVIELTDEDNGWTRNYKIESVKKDGSGLYAALNRESLWCARWMPLSKVVVTNI